MAPKDKPPKGGGGKAGVGEKEKKSIEEALGGIGKVVKELMKLAEAAEKAGSVGGMGKLLKELLRDADIAEKAVDKAGAGGQNKNLDAMAELVKELTKCAEAAEKAVETADESMKEPQRKLLNAKLDAINSVVKSIGQRQAELLRGP
jgi:hypothetical protein